MDAAHQHGAAGGFRAGFPAGGKLVPVVRLDMVHLPQAALTGQAFQTHHRREIAHDMAGHSDNFGFFRFPGQGLHLDRVDPHRFFDQRMLAGPDRGQGVFVMEAVDRTDRGDFHVLQGQGRRQVSSDPAFDTVLAAVAGGSLLFILPETHDRRKVGMRVCGEGAEVFAGHPAGGYDCHAE